jgi:hypothetical protein
VRRFRGVKVKARSLAIALPVFSLIWGCQASLNAEANASASANGEADASADADASANMQAEGKDEMTRQGTAAAGDANALAVSDIPSGRVLLGARHDLKLQGGKGTASCECLSVALGGSRTGGMQWSATPPNIDDSTQLVIALSSEGTACKGEPKGSLGASYWGYRISGNDVIVLVESARGGHPLTSGAVIPRPVGNGQVYVKPASTRLPYGRATQGKGLCKIGNPGQMRSSTFTALELGQDAPAPGARGKQAEASDPNDMPTTIDMSGD